MLRKRLIGVITVKDNIAVQSFGYSNYLPIGRPEIIAKNLDNWGVDEIILQSIDSSCNGAGPNYKLLKDVSAVGLSTPLIYSGGIRNVEDAVSVIKSGADRVCLESILYNDYDVQLFGDYLGSQAVVVSLPLSTKGNKLKLLNYQTGQEVDFSTNLFNIFSSTTVSEFFLIDWKNEGIDNSFNEEIINQFPSCDVPLIAFGGLGGGQQISTIIQSSRVSAVAVGNSLNYREHEVQSIKQKLRKSLIRTPSFKSNN